MPPGTFPRVITAALSVALGCPWGSSAEEPRYAAVPAPQWDAVFDRRDGWIGGDAVYSTPLGEGEILWLFADTFIGQVRDGRRQMGVRMVNNTLARHRRAAPGATPPADDVEFLWGTDGGQPAAWIRPDPALAPRDATPDRTWYWAADALQAPAADGRNRLLIFLWRMAPTNAQVFSFRNAGTTLAVIEQPDAPWQDWRPRQFDVTHARIAADHPPPQNPPGHEDHVDVAWGSEVVRDDSAMAPPRLLIFGYRQRSGRATEMVVARAPAATIERMTCWQFRTADGWSDNVDAATAIARDITTEFSVSRVIRGGQAEWYLVQSAPMLGREILVRRAASPCGPWSRPDVVFRVPLDQQKKQFTYAAKAHPELSVPGELLISYAINSFDFAESSTNADIYRPRFIRLRLDALPQASSAR